jgi:mono/diheme cytochrome c family protein
MKRISLVLCAIVGSMTIACADASRTTNSPAPSTAAPATSPAASTATPDALAAARANYQKTCVACHGETGEGGTVTVEGKKLKVPSYKAPHALKDSDDEFIEQIKEGGDGMPAFKDKLSEAEITDLVKFIRRDFQAK